MLALPALGQHSYAMNEVPSTAVRAPTAPVQVTPVMAVTDLEALSALGQ